MCRIILLFLNTSLRVLLKQIYLGTKKTTKIRFLVVFYLFRPIFFIPKKLSIPRTF